MGSITPTWARKPLANQTQPVGQPVPLGDPGALQPSPGGIPAPSGMPTFDQLPPGVPQGTGAYQQPQALGQPQMPAPSGMAAPPTWGTVGTRLGQSTVRTAPEGGGMSLYGLGVPGAQQGGWLQPSQGQALANPWNPFQGRLSGLVR